MACGWKRNEAHPAPRPLWSIRQRIRRGPRKNRSFATRLRRVMWRAWRRNGSHLCRKASHRLPAAVWQKGGKRRRNRKSKRWRGRSRSWKTAQAPGATATEEAHPSLVWAHVCFRKAFFPGRMGRLLYPQDGGCTTASLREVCVCTAWAYR